MQPEDGMYHPLPWPSFHFCPEELCSHVKLFTCGKMLAILAMFLRFFLQIFELSFDEKGANYVADFLCSALFCSALLSATNTSVLKLPSERDLSTPGSEIKKMFNENLDELEIVGSKKKLKIFLGLLETSSSIFDIPNHHPVLHNTTKQKNQQVFKDSKP